MLYNISLVDDHVIFTSLKIKTGNQVSWTCTLDKAE